MKCIAIVTYYAVTNIGDKILTETLCKLFQDNGVKTKIVDINGRYCYKYHGLVHKLEVLYVNHFRNDTFEDYFKQQLQDVDLVLFGGGAILDFQVTNISNKISVIVEIASSLNKPVAFHSVGLWGEKYDNEKARLLRKALNSANTVFVSVRERCNDVNTYFMDKNHYAVQTFDTALLSGYSYGIKPQENSEKTIGINIISPNAFFYNQISHNVETINNIYISIYHDLENRGYNCFFFTNGVPADNKYLTELLRKHNIDSTKQIKTNSLTGRKFLDILNQFNGVISSRLHTSICCYSLKIPTIALGWENKFSEFYSNISHLDRLVDIRNIKNVSIPLLLESAIKDNYNIPVYDKNYQLVLDGIQKVLNLIK